MVVAASAGGKRLPNVLVAGYPKSGNTWIGYLLSYYLNAPYYDSAIEEGVLTGKIAPDSLRYTYNHDGFLGVHERPDQPRSVRAIIKTHSLPDDLGDRFPQFLSRQDFTFADPVALLVRDPRDVAVSLFFYRHFRMPRVRGKWYARLPYPVRYRVLRYLFFDQLALDVARRWTDFNEKWLQQKPIIVRYRDLLGNPGAELRRLSELLGAPCALAYAMEAVDFCSFSRMREREDRKFEPGAPNERFFRSGKAGGWKKLFQPRLLNAFTRRTGDLPMRLGLA